MGYMVEITENKFDELVDNCEEMVRAGGKVMKCLDSLKRERMGNRMPMPDYRDKWDDEDWRDEEPCYMMGWLCQAVSRIFI